MRVGTDIISVARVERIVERYGEKFLRAHFAEEEIRYCRGKARPARHFAGKLAGKEAVAKVLRIRWETGFSWSDIRILNDTDGAPLAVLAGIPKRFAQERGFDPRTIQVSVSHCDEYATATALAL